jgi:hypothetical protein
LRIGASVAIGKFFEKGKDDHTHEKKEFAPGGARDRYARNFRRRRTNFPRVLGSIQAQDNLSRFPVIVRFATGVEQRSANG